MSAGTSSRVGARSPGSTQLGAEPDCGRASSLLGDPDVLLFDEPFNGLDLDGVRWNRALLRGFADEGHTRAARRLGREHRTG